LLKKILIVDDSQAESRLMQAFCSLRVLAIALSDPLRIEQMLSSEHPNLILLDVVMPGRMVSRPAAN